MTKRCLSLCPGLLAVLMATTGSGAESSIAPPPTAATSVTPDSWPIFRGDSRSTGVASSSLPEQLRLLWKFAPDRGSFDGTAAIVDGAVYLGDMRGKLVCLDLATGKPRWEYATGSGFTASPAVRDGRLYIGDIDGKFYCLQTADGQKFWSFDSEAEIDSSANFFQDNVLFGSQDATLYCLNAKSGELAWKFAIGDQIRCSPTVVEDRCFVAGCDGRLHVVDLQQGQEVASVPIESPTCVTPAAVGDRAYFGTEGGAFFCVDWKQAKVVWTFTGENRGQPYRSCPAVSGRYVVFGGRNKRIQALDLENGNELWQVAVKQRVDSSPIIAGQRVFVGGGDGLEPRELRAARPGGNPLGDPRSRALSGEKIRGSLEYRPGFKRLQACRLDCFEVLRALGLQKVLRGAGRQASTRGSFFKT